MSKSDSGCDTAANAHGQPSEPNRDQKGNLNTLAHCLIDFANQIILQFSKATTLKLKLTSHNMSKSDSGCDTAANAHGQPSEPNRDQKGNLNTLAHCLIDFADKVQACAPTAKSVADDFHELLADEKEAVLKRLVDEIMGNLLEGLPKIEKGEILDECFTALYEKLPWRSQVSVAHEVIKKLGMQESEGSPSLSTTPVSLQSRLPVSLRSRSLSPPGERGERGLQGERGPQGPWGPPENHMYSFDLPATIGGNGNGKGKGQTSGNGTGKEKASGKERVKK